MSPVSHTTQGVRKMTKTVNDDSSGRGTFVAQVRSFVTYTNFLVTFIYCYVILHLLYTDS